MLSCSPSDPAWRQFGDMTAFSQGSAEDLKRMRQLATGALVAVFSGMVVFRILEEVHPAIGFLRAFCEAATVGALADWFAAYFARPELSATPFRAGNN